MTELTPEEIHRRRHDYYKSWGIGEWLDEPDEVEFLHRGIKCRINRAMLMEPSGHIFGGHLCGYIYLEMDHPWANKDYLEYECEVHGGITYCEKCEDKWEIGFDCAHSGDLVPSSHMLFPDLRHSILGRPDIYRNLEYVIVQVKKLADQAIEAMLDKYREIGVEDGTREVDQVGEGAPETIP